MGAMNLRIRNEVHRRGEKKKWYSLPSNNKINFKITHNDSTQLLSDSLLPEAVLNLERRGRELRPEVECPAGVRVRMMQALFQEREKGEFSYQRLSENALNSFKNKDLASK